MNKPPLKDIFLTFLKIGTFSFGGVYSMLSFFEREFVEKRKWLTHDEFVEGVAIGQMTPGPPIVNTGIYIGYKLDKVRGALVATCGQSFTGVAMAIALAVFYVQTQDNIFLKSAMKGVSAAVIGLLVSVVHRMMTRTIKDYKSALFAILAFVLLLLKVNAIIIIFASGLVGIIVYRKWRSSWSS
jgi:chromate transporter